MNTLKEKTATLRKNERRFTFTATRDGVTVTGFVRGFTVGQALARVGNHCGVYGGPLAVAIEEVAL